MIKGKRLTIQQCKIVDNEGYKATSRIRDKETYLIIRNKETNEEKHCLC